MHKSITASSALAAALLLPCGIANADRPATGTWQQISNPPPVLQGLDGKPHTATCSGYPGTDPSFNFWSKRGKSKNLVVYFEGGGACWNDFSCTFPVAPGLPGGVPQFYVPQVPPGGPAGYDGIFNAGNAANPVKDWSFVYIPYCTGDVHVGGGDRFYANVGHPVFPLPSIFQIHHRGFDNFMVVMDWVRKNVDKPERVLVAGSSAGGYGASANFPWVQQAFPKAKLSVLADASMGVLSQNFDHGNPGRNSWTPQLKAGVFGPDPNAVPSPALLSIGAASFPKARVAQFTTNFDAVQIQFHGLAATFNGPGGSCPNNLPIQWNGQALAALSSTVANTPNYRHYVAAGQYHTILRSPQMYSEASTGRPFTDWLTAMLKGDDEDEDRAPWDNQACANCLLPLPCPAP